MREADKEREAEAQRWFAIADRDISAARNDLAAQPPLVEDAAYHCQQACEKFLKGCLVRDGQIFPRSHDLVELSVLVMRRHPELSGALSPLQEITVWGTAYRYPMEEEAQKPPTVAEILATLEKISLLREGIVNRK